jgi:hypothetical protein
MLIEQVSGLRLTQADFAAHRGEWVQPYNTTYHLRNISIRTGIQNWLRFPYDVEIGSAQFCGGAGTEETTW